MNSSCTVVPWKTPTRSAAKDQKFFRQCRRQTANQNKAFKICLSKVIKTAASHPAGRRQWLTCVLLTTPSHRGWISDVWSMFSVPDIHRNKTYKYRNICFMLDTPKLGNRKPMKHRCYGLENEPRLWFLSFNWSSVSFILGSAPLLSSAQDPQCSPLCPRLSWQLLPQQRQQVQLCFATCNPSLWN